MEIKCTLRSHRSFVIKDSACSRGLTSNSVMLFNSYELREITQLIWTQVSSLQKGGARACIVGLFKNEIVVYEGQTTRHIEIISCYPSHTSHRHHKMHWALWVLYQCAWMFLWLLGATQTTLCTKKTELVLGPEVPWGESLCGKEEPGKWTMKKSGTRLHPLMILIKVPTCWLEKLGKIIPKSTWSDTIQWSKLEMQAAIFKSWVSQCRMGGWIPWVSHKEKVYTATNPLWVPELLSPVHTASILTNMGF